MELPSININQEKLSRFEDAVQKEWIITNGLGGYASSTILGINTRKYHGLLIAAFHPPGDRWVCLAKLDEEIIIGNSIYPLGANEFQDRIFPKGYIFMKEFSVSPLPKHVYEAQNVRVEKIIFMPYEKNAVIILYKVSNRNESEIKIRVFPLVNGRHFHLVRDKWKNPLEFIQKAEEKGVQVCFGFPKHTLIINTTSGRYIAKDEWVEKIFYREESARGESCVEDCYKPGYFDVDIDASKNAAFAIIAVADEACEVTSKALAEASYSMYDVESLYERENERYKNLLTNFYEEHKSLASYDWLNWIILAADTFMAKRAKSRQTAVIAGYHWFEVWGRDTFISMPGLMLVTGKFENARMTFLTFKEYCKNGLIPNFISDAAKHPAYNAVDVTLWYVNAVLQYLKYTGDFKFVQEHLWQNLQAIMEKYERGTAFNIHVDSDGLLSHGSQLTWMDAVVDGQPVTPRAGKAVEIQALWYNALKTMEILANRFKEKNETEKYLQMTEKTRKSFVEKFWNPEKNYLFDVVNEQNRDDPLRPNQIIAVALDFSMLDTTKSEKIVDITHRELLTPYGLRTLRRDDPRYVGVYAGDRRSRDKAYHNGTVWPWLLGPFTTAFLRTKGYAEYRREYALKNFLLPLFTEQIFKAGLGTISEIFDGEPPYTPRGCIAQAWSVAEPLRAYVEDVMLIRPKHEREVLHVLR